MMKLRKEISAIILLKLLGLSLLWWFFFSQPVDKSLYQSQLAQHYTSMEKYGENAGGS